MNEQPWSNELTTKQAKTNIETKWAKESKEHQNLNSIHRIKVGTWFWYHGKIKDN